MFLYIDEQDGIRCPKCAKGVKVTRHESTLEFWHCHICKKPLLKTGFIPRLRKFASKFAQLIKEF